MVTPRLTRYIPHEPTDRQVLALVAHRFVDRPEDPVEIFYGGAAGGGKSDWLLMAGLQYVDQPQYAGIIFRRTYAQLSKPGALIDRSKSWLSQTDARWNEQEKVWHFPTGASLAFGYLDSAGDEENYQSAEFQYIGFDELTHFEERHYTYLFSRLRRLEGQDIPLRLCGASNPGSRGHGWVRDRLVDGVAPNRVFIPAKLDDNPHLDKAAYMSSLSHLRPALQQQLRDGDWEAFEGMAYRVIDQIHTIRPFKVPNEWTRFEAMDYGTANPCWLCFATDYDGNVIATGLEQTPGDIGDQAARVWAKREEWWARDQRGDLIPALTYAPQDVKTGWGKRDPNGRELSPETEFADHGITFATAQQDRRSGFQRIRAMLKLDPDRPFPRWHPLAGQKGSPGLFFFDTDEVAPLIRNLRDAPLEDPDSTYSRFPGEAVDFDWEHSHGHAHAACRYGLMSRPAASEVPAYVPHPGVRALRDQWGKRNGDREYVA